MSMINLMPPDAKENIVYARRNSVMRKWIIGVLLVIAGMGVMLVFGGIYIDGSKKSLQTSIDQTKQAIANEKLDEVKTQALAISDGVKLIVQVLQKEVLFSKFFPAVGAIMPSGSNLEGLSLSNEVTGAIDITVSATDFQTATKVQVNIEDPKNNLFDKVDNTGVNCDSKAAGPYKCRISLRVQFKKDASLNFTAAPPKTTNTQGAVAP
jgi:hypothetical protein